MKIMRLTGCGNFWSGEGEKNMTVKGKTAYKNWLYIAWYMLCQYQNKPVVADLCICSACSTSEVPCKGHTCIGARLQLIRSTSQFLYSAKLKVKLFLLLSGVISWKPTLQIYLHWANIYDFRSISLFSPCSSVKPGRVRCHWSMY